jgi:hypothetical protein
VGRGKQAKRVPGRVGGLLQVKRVWQVHRGGICIVSIYAPTCLLMWPPTINQQSRALSRTLCLCVILVRVCYCRNKARNASERFLCTLIFHLFTFVTGCHNSAFRSNLHSTIASSQDDRLHTKMISNERKGLSQMRTSRSTKWQRPETSSHCAASSENNVNAATEKVRQDIRVPEGNRIASSDDVLCQPVCCDESIDNANFVEESQICSDDESHCITNQYLGSQEEEMFDWEEMEEPSALPSITNEDKEIMNKPSICFSFCMDPVSFSEMSSGMLELEGELQTLIEEDLLEVLSASRLVWP